MRKRIGAVLTGISMLFTIIQPVCMTAVKASGDMIITASQDAYVQGSSQANIAKGAEDPNNLSGRDWSDKPGCPAAYQLPYIQFELPSSRDFEDVSAVTKVVLKAYCISGTNDEYIVGLSNISSFDENTFTYSQAAAAEKKYPEGANNANRLGFDHEPVRIEGSAVHIDSVTGEWLEFDVTSAVKRLIAENTSAGSRSAVFALAPRSREAYPGLSYHGSIVFASKEYKNGAYAPRLEINANSFAEREKQAVSDYYGDGFGETFEDEKLFAGGTYSSVIEFTPDTDMYAEDTIDEAAVILTPRGDSAEPEGLKALLAGNGGESDTELNIEKNDDGTYKIDVSDYFGAENNIRLRICADNGSSTPVIFHSSRSDDLSAAPVLRYRIRYVGAVSEIRIDGDENIEVSLLENKSVQYDITAYDRYGARVSTSGMDITYSLDRAPDGVSITPTGLLTVEKTAAEGTAVIRASRDDMPDIYGILEVAVSWPPVAEIEIRGAIKAKQPSPGIPLRKPYSAVGYDAAGNKMPDGLELEWEIKQAPEGVSIEKKSSSEITLVLDNSDNTISLGDVIELFVCWSRDRAVNASVSVEVGTEDEVYSVISIPAVKDTYIKKQDYQTSGNINSGELLAKTNTKTSKIVNTVDYFPRENTNREIYLQFGGMENIPENIISAKLIMTSCKNYEDTSGGKAPESGMPGAVISPLKDYGWSEEGGAIKERVAADTSIRCEAAYGTKADSKTEFDIKDIIEERRGEAELGLRLSMSPINSNYYTHKYYSKEATYTDEASGIALEIPEDKKPHIEIVASYVRVPTGIVIEGDELAGIKLYDEQYEYRVYLTDQYGQKYTDDEMAEFSTSLRLETESSGAVLEGNTLKVPAEAEAGDIILSASADVLPGVSVEKTITLYKAQAAVINLDGPEYIQHPKDGESVYADYSLEVYDQNGVKLNISDVVYELAEPQTGVSVDSGSGRVCVADYAFSNREFVLNAYSVSVKSIKKSKAVQIRPRAEMTGMEQHPNLLYGSSDLPALREKINVEPFATYYANLKQTADTYTSAQLRSYAVTDSRELQDEYDHVYPLVETDEDGNERVLDRERPWQWMMTDLFYTQGNFAFTPPTRAKYARLQAIAKGQGITNFDKFTLRFEGGDSIELKNADMETGNRRYVDEDIDYTDGSQYQVVETSSDGTWEYINDVKSPMPDNFYYIRKSGSSSEFEWDDQTQHTAKVTTSGVKAAKIRNNTVGSEAGISTDKISVVPGKTYVLSTGFGANDKLIGEQGRIKEYSPLDKTAGLYMKVVYYDADGREIGNTTWFDNPASGKPMNINWQVKPLRRGFDNPMDACAAVYAITGNIDYAERAKLMLQYQLEDMKWGMQYRIASGYNTKMNDSYEAVHTGRTLQRDALIYDMIYDSGVITEEEDAQIRENFNYVAYKLTSTAYFNYTNASGQIHNYNADRISGLILFMLCFPENEGTEQNGYKDTFDFFYNHTMDADNVWSLPRLMKKGIYDAGEEYGGMWCENIRYHGSVHAGWMLVSKALDRFYPDANYMQSNEMKKMAKMWVTAQGPRLVVSTTAKNLAGYPTVGDAYWREVADRAAWCASFYKDTDPELSAELMYTWDRMGAQLGGSYPINILMDNDPTLPRKNPKLGSVYLNNVGYMYFRQNFDILGKENLVLIPNSPGYGNKNQPIHDHSDRGSFAYFANGTPMSLDSGVGSYFGTDTAFWRSSRSHNEVLFWSDSRGWLSNAGGDGNSYTSDTAKTRNYDSETVGQYTSQEIDRATVRVNPATRAGKETNLQWNRHFAYLKDGFDALIYWDEVLNTRKSQFNLYLTSTSYTQDNNMILAEMQNNMQMEVYLLNADNPSITESWVPSNGKYGIPAINNEEKQQLIQYEQSGGEDYLTVMYPKQSGTRGLTQSRLDTGNDNVQAYRMTKALTGKSFYIIYNDGDSAAEVNLGLENTVRDPQTGYKTVPGDTVSIEAGKLYVFVDDSVEKPYAQKIELSGDTDVGVPYAGKINTYSYDAVVYDQYGNTIDGADIKYSIENAGAGCTVSDDGQIIIEDTFEDSGITLNAAYENVSASMSINVIRNNTSVSGVNIIGSNTLVIPKDGSVSYNYGAVFVNSSGGTVAGVRPIWKILIPADGISINSYTGKITVEAGVKNKSVIHLNVTSYNDPSVTSTLEVICVEGKASGISASAPKEIAKNQNKTKSVRLSGYVADQAGNKFSDTPVLFKLDYAPEGVTLDGAEAVLSVSPAAQTGTVRLTAYAVDNEMLSTQLEITITENAPQKITVTGPDSVQTDGSASKQTYAAELIDKNGDAMETEIIWSVSGISGITVENGTVTIPKGAYGTFKLTAYPEEYPLIKADKTVKVTIRQSAPPGGGGGGGGTGAASGGYNTQGSTGPDVSGSADREYYFTDVPKTHWASGYIYSLAASGIVSGRTETAFEPESTITRCEFVKLLVSALDISGGDRQMPYFEDCTEQDWYYPYVEKAYKCGVVNGVSESRFDAHSSITREQMAAMLYRAAAAAGMSVADAADGYFDDDASISEYAKQAIYALKSVSVLNGTGGNMFNPKDNTKRCEAAKVIKCLMDLR